MHLVGSKAQVAHKKAFMTPTGHTKDEITRTDGQYVSKARKKAAQQNPGLTAWRQAIEVYKRVAKIPKSEFTLSPKKGTKQHKELMEIYSRLYKKNLRK